MVTRDLDGTDVIWMLLFGRFRKRVDAFVLFFGHTWERQKLAIELGLLLQPGPQRRLIDVLRYYNIGQQRIHLQYHGSSLTHYTTYLMRVDFLPSHVTKRAL